MKKNNGKFYFSLIIALLLTIILVIFAIKNSDMVTVDLFFKKIEISLALLIVVCAFIGALIVGSIMTIKNILVNNENKKLQKILALRDNEILKLKAEVSVRESQKRTLEINNPIERNDLIDE